MGTTTSDFLPNATGLNLGSPDQRWDGFFGDIVVTGTVNGSGASTDLVQNFSTSQSLSFGTSINAMVLGTGGVGGISLILPSAIDHSGQSFRIKKTDSGVGAVTVIGSIDGAANYALTNQYQYVVLESGNGTWQVVGNN